MSESCESNESSEPPCSGSTTYKDRVKTPECSTLECKNLGCLKCHPSKFHAEIHRPQAPFHPRSFDWLNGSQKIPIIKSQHNIQNLRVNQMFVSMI